MQTKWQKAYGIRRTLANRLERQAQAVRKGDWALARKINVGTAEWADRKISEMTGKA